MTFILETTAGAQGIVASGQDPGDPAIVPLMAMWVHPELRGTDAASALLEAVLTWATDQGAARQRLSSAGPDGASHQRATDSRKCSHRFTQITPAAPLTAPEVHPDRRVTFYLRAPDASKVELNLTPVGLRTIVKNTAGRATHDSLIEVPGAPARFDERQDVPHGVLHIREYTSNVLKLRRRVVVYVPPQYDSEGTRRFPVLYLRHGSAGLEGTWSEVGRAGVILDNLVARRKALPMISVMPNGYASDLGDGATAEAVEATGKELYAETLASTTHD